MKIVKTVLEDNKTEDKIIDIICDRCNDSCFEIASTIGHRNECHASVKATGNYGSTFPPDMSKWSFHLCQYCFAWLVSTLRHRPKQMEYGFGAESKDKETNDDRELDALIDGNPRRYLATYNNGENHLSKVFEKANLDLGKLTKYAIGGKTVKNMLSDQNESSPAEKVNRSFIAYREYDGRGVFEYTLTMVTGSIPDDQELPAKLMKSQWPEFVDPGVTYSGPASDGVYFWQWKVINKELVVLEKEQNDLYERISQIIGDGNFEKKFEEIGE